MATREVELWMVLSQDLTGCKLIWVQQELTKLNVPWKVGGYGMRGHRLLVADTHATVALSVLMTVVGELYVGSEHKMVLADDLPNDHPFFVQTLEMKSRLVHEGDVERTPDISELIRTLEMQERLVHEGDVERATDDVTEIEVDMQEAERRVLEDMEQRVAKDFPQVDLEALKNKILDEDDDWDLDDDLEPIQEESESHGTIVVDIMPIQEGPELPFKLEKYPGPQNTEFDVMMFDVKSSNMSRMGHRQGIEDAGTFFVQFKGNPSPYSYFPVPEAIWDELYIEAEKAQRNEPDASLGSLFHNLVKEPWNNGKMTCEKLDGAAWVEITPAKKRVKEIKKKHSE